MKPSSASTVASSISSPSAAPSCRIPNGRLKVKHGRFSELRDYDGAAIKTYY